MRPTMRAGGSNAGCARQKIEPPWPNSKTLLSSSSQLGAAIAERPAGSSELAGRASAVSMWGLTQRAPAGTSGRQREAPRAPSSSASSGRGLECHAKPPAANRWKCKIGEAWGRERVIPSLLSLAASCDDDSPTHASNGRLGIGGHSKLPRTFSRWGRATRGFRARGPGPCPALSWDFGPCARAARGAHATGLGSSGPRHHPAISCWN